MWGFLGRGVSSDAVLGSFVFVVVFSCLKLKLGLFGKELEIVGSETSFRAGLADGNERRKMLGRAGMLFDARVDSVRRVCWL